jgi:hypothetical protein
MAKDREGTRVRCQPPPLHEVHLATESKVRSMLQVR